MHKKFKPQKKNFVRPDWDEQRAYIREEILPDITVDQLSENAKNGLVLFYEIYDLDLEDELPADIVVEFLHKNWNKEFFSMYTERLKDLDSGENIINHRNKNFSFQPKYFADEHVRLFMEKYAAELINEDNLIPKAANGHPDYSNIAYFIGRNMFNLLPLDLRRKITPNILLKDVICYDEEKQTLVARTAFSHLLSYNKGTHILSTLIWFERLETLQVFYDRVRHELSPEQNSLVQGFIGSQILLESSLSGLNKKRRLKQTPKIG